MFLRSIVGDYYVELLLILRVLCKDNIWQLILELRHQ